MYNRFATALLSCLLLTFSAIAQPVLPPGAPPPPPRPPAGGGGQTAALQTVTADEVAAIVRENGKGLQNVETTKLGELPAVIVRGWRGFNVGIAFYGCEAEGCVSFQIFTIGKAPSHVNLQYVNDWNVRLRFTKLYLDTQNNFVLSLDVISKGGVTRDNILAYLGLYDWMLVELRGEKHEQ
jgi:Putative bacterial sensory transduction regulator